MKKNTYLFGFIFMLFLGLFFVSCDFLDDHIKHPVKPKCNEKAVLDHVAFPQVNTTNYGITNMVLNGDCLEITVSSSGCNPNNWDMNLIGVASTTNIYPPLFHAKIELINNEACQAVFQKTVSFDLTPFQITGQNNVQINIAGWNNSIMYQY